MSAFAWHLMLRLRGNRLMAHLPPDLRVLSRVLLEQGSGYDLLAFGAADTHLHALLVGERCAAARFVQRTAVSLRARLGFDVRFERTRFKPVDTQDYLRDCFRYVLRQDSRHELLRDPFREGTNLADLLGLRLLGAPTAASVRRLLPRTRRADLLALMPPLGRDDPPDLDDLAEAAAAASCVPTLAGKAPAVVAARRAAVHLGLERLGPSELARHLGVSLAAVKRLRAQPRDDRLLEAIRRQLRMRYAAHTAALDPTGIPA